MKTENDLVEIVRTSFRDRGFLVNTEVPMLSKRIDILCMNPDTNDVIAVEAKIQKWKRAFQQALTYRLCSNLVYIAIHHDFSHRVNKELLQKHGVGLIVVNHDDIDIPLEALPSTIMHQGIKEDVMPYIGGERPVPF
jgi:hypothetical protein